MSLLTYGVVFVLAYLIGAIPWGYVVGRWHGVDVRKHGSGKTGGTNVARLVGWRNTLPVVLGDPGKAAVAVLLARYFTHDEVAVAVAALAVLIGHNWSIYIGWHGGRGVGTAFGAALVFNPLIAISVAVLFGLIALISRYVSLASMTSCVIGAALLSVAWAIGYQPAPHAIVSWIITIMIVVRHHDNITRLLAGTERRLGERVVLSGEQSGAK